MKKKQFITVGAGLLLGVSQSLAVGSAVDVTIVDFNTGPNTKWSNPIGLGPDFEDNETEAPANAGQHWDQEAMALTPITGSTPPVIHLVGGFDYQNGVELPTGATGDLFIKVGGTNPGFQPTANSGTVLNSPTYGSPGYTYAVDLSDGLVDVDPFALGIQVTVWKLKNSTVLETVQYDYLASNPWRVKETGAGNPDVAWTGTTTVSYQSGLTAAQVATYTGVGGYTSLQGYGANLNHNILDIDMSFVSLATATDTVNLSYTMQCGNDSLKGRTSGGFRVPDGGMTLSLLGLGMGALAVASRKKR